MKIATTLFFVSIIMLSCDSVSPSAQKQIEKTGKEIAKQVKATTDHFDTRYTYIGFEATPETKIKMFWKDDRGALLGSLGRLKAYVEGQGDTLLYACNAGMYMENRSPLGYYVQDGKLLQILNSGSGSGNFYLKPKAVFYVEENGKAYIEPVETAVSRKKLIEKNIAFASQSGPMVLENGIINPLFKRGSTNLNVRNGVGILANGNAYFAMSTFPVSFYDFALHFKEKGCSDALYFDGFVSRSYCPSLGYEQLDGYFGVMVGVVK